MAFQACWSSEAWATAWVGVTRWTRGSSKSGSLDAADQRGRDVGAHRVLADVAKDLLPPLGQIPVHEDLRRCGVGCGGRHAGVVVVGGHAFRRHHEVDRCVLVGRDVDAADDDRARFDLAPRQRIEFGAERVENPCVGAY